MEFDLRTFPDERAGRIVALGEPEALDRYTYLVAGCVGEFWTTMTAAHMPGAIGMPDTMLRRGIRFGKALQMTNVLRDCGKDLRIGRCYLPATMLEQYGLRPQDLLLPDASLRARALMRELVRKTLEHFCEAMAYTLAIPPRFIRLRLACLWPVLIGMETLLLLVRNDDWLDPAKTSRLQRSKVYRIIAYSLPMVLSNSLLRIWFARRCATSMLSSADSMAGEYRQHPRIAIEVIPCDLAAGKESSQRQVAKRAAYGLQLGMRRAKCGPPRPEQLI